MLNKIIWVVATILLMYSGIYFTIKLKGVQFNLLKMVKGLHKNEETTISPFQSLMLSTAAKIGVGSISGIAIALYFGNEGTIFWLWVTSFFLAPNAYVESLFGAKFKEKNNGLYKGGPSYYIKKGLNNKELSIIYAILVITLYILCFSSIQSNTIATSIYHTYHINKTFLAITITAVSAVIIFKNIKDLIKIISYFVPIMCVFYLVIGVSVILHNADQFPNLFKKILIEAFNFKAFFSGFLTSFIMGIQRGIFASEAGIGTGAIAAATSDTKDYKSQGYTQMLGVYFTSLIICTISALLILTSPYKDITLQNINGIEISLFALKHHLGTFGELFLIISIVLFAFSTIIAGYYYGESNLAFLTKKTSKLLLFLFKCFVLLILYLGATSNPSILWNISDFVIGLLSIINVYSILKLYRQGNI